MTCRQTKFPSCFAAQPSTSFLRSRSTVAAVSWCGLLSVCRCEKRRCVQQLIANSFRKPSQSFRQDVSDSCLYRSTCGRLLGWVPGWKRAGGVKHSVMLMSFSQLLNGKFFPFAVQEVCESLTVFRRCTANWFCCVVTGESCTNPVITPSAYTTSDAVISSESVFIVELSLTCGNGAQVTQHVRS